MNGARRHLRVPVALRNQPEELEELPQRFTGSPEPDERPTSPLPEDDTGALDKPSAEPGQGKARP